MFAKGIVVCQLVPDVPFVLVTIDSGQTATRGRQVISGNHSRIGCYRKSNHLPSHGVTLLAFKLTDLIFAFNITICTIEG
ncbi:hypothetical protein D3C87_1313020 [compost metagenome]